MGFFRELFKPFKEKKTTSRALSYLLGTSSESYNVTEDTATQASIVYACAKILSEDCGKLPISVYKKVKGTSFKDDMHPLTSLIGMTPNEYHTAIEFKEWLTWDLVIRGNAFAYLNRNKEGKLLEILPLSYNSVQIEKKGKDYQYSLKIKGGEKKAVKRSEILHLRDQTLDGVIGISRISYAKKTIAFALAVENFGYELFQNGGTPSGVITHPGQLGDTARKKLKDAFGSDAAKRGTPILDEGMKWEQSSLSAEDSQFLETRKFQRDEILQIFRMPPHKVGDLSRATYSNIEQKAREYLSDTLTPWIIRWEQALFRDLLTDQEKIDNYYFKYNINALVRADIETRYKSYQIAISNSLLSPNECRELEDLPPIDGGDTYYHPANMLEVGADPLTTLPGTNGKSNTIRN